MKKSQTCKVLAIFGVLAAAPLVFGFTSNRVSHYADGCVNHINHKESEKTLRKREKATLANLQARDLALAFRGHTR